MTSPFRVARPQGVAASALAAFVLWIGVASATDTKPTPEPTPSPAVSALIAPAGHPAPPVSVEANAVLKSVTVLADGLGMKRLSMEDPGAYYKSVEEMKACSDRHSANTVDVFYRADKGGVVLLVTTRGEQSGLTSLFGTGCAKVVVADTVGVVVLSYLAEVIKGSHTKFDIRGLLVPDSTAATDKDGSLSYVTGIGSVILERKDKAVTASLKSKEGEVLYKADYTLSQ
jgi:hypothetical protein